MMKNKFVYSLHETLNSYTASKTLESESGAYRESLYTLLTEEHCKSFYQISAKICELEALTFQTEENKNQLKIYYTEFNKFTHKLNNDLSQVISVDEWRFMAGLFCCFMEWCDNICYFNLTQEEQNFIWPENPLVTFDIFNF